MGSVCKFFLRTSNAWISNGRTFANILKPISPSAKLVSSRASAGEFSGNNFFSTANAFSKYSTCSWYIRLPYSLEEVPRMLGMSACAFSWSLVCATGELLELWSRAERLAICRWNSSRMRSSCRFVTSTFTFSSGSAWPSHFEYSSPFRFNVASSLVLLSPNDFVSDWASFKARSAPG